MIYSTEKNGHILLQVNRTILKSTCAHTFKGSEKEHACTNNIPGTTADWHSHYYLGVHPITLGNGSQMTTSSSISFHETRSAPSTARLSGRIFQNVRNFMQNHCSGLTLASCQTTSNINFEHLLSYNHSI
ncbi:hypothetical protein TNCV_2329431 [Trichonephila clavipes]|nr:hypothetical protein TNCV_2329431 [Trichonephila clavipes]